MSCCGFDALSSAAAGSTSTLSTGSSTKDPGFPGAGKSFLPSGAEILSSNSVLKPADSGSILDLRRNSNSESSYSMHAEDRSSWSGLPSSSQGGEVLC